MLLLRKWATKSPFFFSKVISNWSLLYLYWPASTNFVSNVARESKRVAHPCCRAKSVKFGLLVVCTN